ncbi:MAG: hypothetical protein AAGA09_06885 [Pseudomonadota bacterium]
MLKRMHAVAGVVGFLLIAVFWTSTVWVELAGAEAAIAAVKSAIRSAMIVLVPTLALVGVTGMRLGRKRRDAPALAKKRRMPIITLNGLLVLVPAAFFLAAKAEAGEFDRLFYGVQTLELIAGAVNLVLIGLNVRDGVAMARTRRFLAQ